MEFEMEVDFCPEKSLKRLHSKMQSLKTYNIETGFGKEHSGISQISNGIFLLTCFKIPVSKQEESKQVPMGIEGMLDL